MKKYHWVGILTISFLFTANTLSQELILCSDNDLECVNRHIDSVKSLEIKKIETNETAIIEVTRIKLTNAINHTYTEFPDMQSSPGFKIEKREKSVQAVADISVDDLKAIRNDPKNSILKKAIQTCPNLYLSENIDKLKGAKAHCILNENITLTYLPEDIYWCDNHSGCRHGPFPDEMDERLQLLSDGISTSFKCTGSLVEHIQSICTKKD